MVRLRDFNPPPSYCDLFFRWIGIPRSTGLDLYVGDYAYGVGLSTGKRMRYRFPSRQGISGTLITPSQTIQREHFRAALDVWNEQPAYTDTDTAYGPRGRNWWFEGASGLGFFTINYVMGLQLPHEIESTPAPWDPNYYLAIHAAVDGDRDGYRQTPPMSAGTYRVKMNNTPWGNSVHPNPFIIACTIYIRRTDDSLDVVGPIGESNPTVTYEYSPNEDHYITQAAAWAGYRFDSIHVTRDVVLANGERIALQYRNYKPVGPFYHEGYLSAKITRLP